MKSSVFWDITPWNPLKVSIRFGGIFRLHLQGWDALFSVCFILVSCFLTLQPSRWRWRAVPKRRLNFTGIHGVISQKSKLFLLPNLFASAVETGHCVLSILHGDFLYFQKNVTYHLEASHGRPLNSYLPWILILFPPNIQHVPSS
jgi:hypothetical protein